MKSVCIVGAGPAGLVAAKTFLQTGKFQVTVYEKNRRIGGIWALDRKSGGDYLSPYTPTNLSRFTVGFSDLDWNSVDLDSCKTGEARDGAMNAPGLPMFPKAWMASLYLEKYRQKYIPNGIIQCGREVVKVERKGDGWTVDTNDANGDTKTTEFDYLLMASGFFNKPRPIAQDVLNVADGSPVKMIHSSSFRHLDDLFPADADRRGKKILVIGAGNSGGETAAAVALQLSNTQWSPDASSAERYRGCRIVHVTPRPFYPLPHFHEATENSRSYLPLDLKLYDFSRRPQGVESYAGLQDRAIRDVVHGFMQGMVGGDQSDVSSVLVSKKSDEVRGSAVVAIAESYAEYVRSGMIELVRGRVTSAENDKDSCADIVVKQDDKQIKVDNVGAIIYATGYTPIPALNMLDDETKAAINFDHQSMRLPIILEQWQTMSSDASNISFLGFYEGPYWPIMEMQARLTARRWLQGKNAEKKPYESHDQLEKLRQHMHDKELDVPQFWFSDYLGYMEDMANELDLERNHGDFSPREGISLGARYLSEQSDRSEANAIMKDLNQIWHDCLVNGKYVPRAAFRALHGNWDITRRINSNTSACPSGTLEGTASFHPRFPTADKTGTSFDLEYLYIESGTFTMSNGCSLTTKRRYVYRYREADDTLSVWFVKPNNDLEVDYLFHNLDFVKPEEARKEGALVAKADHLCVKDMYTTEYRLPMNAIALREFEVSHTVKGPNKDYIARTYYTRPKK